MKPILAHTCGRYSLWWDCRNRPRDTHDKMDARELENHTCAVAMPEQQNAASLECGIFKAYILTAWNPETPKQEAPRLHLPCWWDSKLLSGRGLGRALGTLRSQGCRVQSSLHANLEHSLTLSVGIYLWLPLYMARNQPPKSTKFLLNFVLNCKLKKSEFGMKLSWSSTALECTRPWSSALYKPSMVVHPHNPRSQEAEAGDQMPNLSGATEWVWGQIVI